MKLNRIAWTVCAAVFCGSVLTASASTGSYEGVVTSVDGCEGGFDNGKHKAGVLGLSGLSLAEAMRLRAEAGVTNAARDTSVIFVWLAGGPPHMETYA